MPQRRILFIDGTHLHAFRSNGDAVIHEGRFTSEPTGIESFSGYLNAHHQSIFSLLADVPEEGFQIEDIPHVTGKDRDALIKRKIGQYFYGTPYAIAASQGRLKTGRRDERLLLMALTRAQQFEPWLSAAEAQPLALTGMYSVPQLIEQLIPKEVTAPLLLITQTHGGLRQSFFSGRQLLFSRLTALATGSVTEAAVAAQLEAGKMQHYLVSQRLIDRNKPLVTRLLAHPTQMSAMRDRCTDTGELHFEFADLLQEAGRLGLRSPLPNSHAEMLFCHLLARRAPSRQFAPPSARAHYRLWQTRFGLKIASLVILAGTLLFAAKQGVSLFGLRESTAEILLQAQQDQSHYDTAMQALPKIPLSAEKLRALTDRYDHVEKRAIGPQPLLAQLSQSLNFFSAISIDRVEWLVTEDIAPAAAGGAGPKDTPPVPPQMSSGPYAHVLVSARLPMSTVGDQRGQLKLVADFMQHLNTEPNSRAIVLTPPVDTESGKTLRSGDDSRVSESPRFVFRLSRKL